jgi:hypothetical protein
MDVPTVEAHPLKPEEFDIQPDAAAPRVVSTNGDSSIAQENT